MYTVTGRIHRIKQPYGGYLRVSNFNVKQFDDGKSLLDNENVHPGLIGLVVDYLTRFLMGASLEDAFQISLLGAREAKEIDTASLLLSDIVGLNEKSVISACKLAGYDVCIRFGMSRYKPVSDINPDENTIENIITLVSRCIDFWRIYGPIVLDGFEFEEGYTPVISAGDGDYLTKDTIWDFKVSKNRPTSKYTLQLLVYYLMGLHSSHKEFANINYLGIFNPRLNKAYTYPVKEISEETIRTVSHDVIGYGWTEKEYEQFQKEALGPLAIFGEIMKKLNK